MKGSLFRQLCPSKIKRSKESLNFQKSKCTALPPGFSNLNVSENILFMCEGGIS